MPAPHEKDLTIKPFLSVAAKTYLTILVISNKTNIQKIFDGELFIRTLSTGLLQTLNSKVIFKSKTGPDDTAQATDQA